MDRTRQRPTTHNPITVAGFKTLLARFGYDCLKDEEPVLQFRKNDTPPKGFEKAYKYWEEVLTWRYPDYHSDKHNELVYSLSEVLDFLQNRVMISNPGVDRTQLGLEIRAVLKPDEAPPKEPDPKEDKGPSPSH